MSKTVGEALRLPPWRFLASAWPWRALLYAVTSMAWALPLSFGDRAAVLLPFLPLLGIWISAVERRRIRLVGYPAIRSGHAPVPRAMRKRWLLIRLGEAMTWREVGYALIATALGAVIALTFYAAATLLAALFAAPIAVAVYEPITIMGWTAAAPWEAWPLPVLGILILIALLYLSALLGWVQASIARALLTPKELELQAQIDALTLSRKVLVQAVESERGRIERDLHDGVQQHMVVLAMQLGTLELELQDLHQSGADTSRASGVLAAAHASSQAAHDAMRQALLNLRAPTLTEFGLGTALRELADAMPLPVIYVDNLSDRLSSDVEHTSYLIASEACTNALRHAQASQLRMSINTDGGLLELRIEDDGQGGAFPRPGGGLAGLRERADVIGGSLQVNSPRGGPTVVRLLAPVETEERTA
ncbi:MAG: sensor domain-containing protein [Arachnia sp.]